MSFRFEPNRISALRSDSMFAAIDRRSFPADPTIESGLIARGAAADNAERIFDDGAICVTSGQQPGLLTGPLYTVYKALSAAALARRLEVTLGRSVIPVFWVAGDDHDFAESNHCYLVSSPGEVECITLRQREGDAVLTPMYKEPVGHDIEAVVAKLKGITPETEFRPRVLEWIESHYTPDTDMSTAFGCALAELLGRFGVVVFLPTRLEIKRLMASRLMLALEHAGAIDRALGAHARDMKAAGRPAPIAVGEGATTVMIEASLGRDRLLLEGAELRTRRSGERYSMSSLQSLVAKTPDLLSPNVLLRPVLEAVLLPTVAYVAGPGELEYLPQAEPIYGTLEVEPQATVPRWSGLVIEKRTAKSLSKYGITPADLRLAEGQLEARIMKHRIPGQATEAINRLKEVIASEYGKLSRSATEIDSALKKPISAAERGALRDLADVEKRIVRHLKQQDETTVRQIAGARASLFPFGKHQERIINIAHYLIRYGEEFLDAAFAECMRWADRLETDFSGE